MARGLDRDWLGGPLRVGDRVTWASSIACGECYYCRLKRQPTRCLTRKAYGISYCASDPPHLRGGYAEKILLRAGSSIFRLPDAVPNEALIGAGCALTTAIHAFERAPLEWGDTVVVQGTGPVGLAAIAVARVAGASKIWLSGARRTGWNSPVVLGRSLSWISSRFPGLKRAARRYLKLSDLMEPTG